MLPQPIIPVKTKAQPSKFKISYGTVQIWPKTMALIKQALTTTQVSTGPLVPAFEQRFAELIGAKYAIATSSGTDACAVIIASLLDTGAKRGDEVIIPALTFSATANAVLMAGLTPVFVDVDPLTLNINPALIKTAINPKTRALFPVHLMGKPAPMNELFKIANKHNLELFEDACQAHGATYHDQRVGSFSTGAAFSLYAAHLICTGEGGMITTNSQEHAELYRSLRSHGRPAGQLDFDFQRVGFNSKMNELEAALGLAACDHYENIRAQRKHNLDVLTHTIGNMPGASRWLWLSTQLPHEQIGPQGCPIVVRDNAPFTRQDLVLALTAASIETKTLFGSLPTQHKAYQFLNYQPGTFPISEWVGRQGLHIGVHQELTDKDLTYITDVFRQFLAHYA